jgi:Fibronectin type III domain
LVAGDAAVGVDRHVVALGPLRETPKKTLTVAGLTAGKTYTFTVKAQNTVGYGAESADRGRSRRPR